ncbi:hypothetical protein FJZ53_06480 [Candidatus Woesearchaeota archaeon]|nr:hypothetical protein [Candidatus Woesearchaeota archaeon]
MDRRKKRFQGVWLDASIILLLLILIVGLKLVRFDLKNKITGAVPFGATPSEVRSETSIAPAPSPIGAIAGNVTEVIISGYSVTQSWQGYMGNVTGVITLEDSSNYTMYNWNVTNPQGEVYAANNSVTWTNIQCFNLTATGTDGSCDQTATAGGMNLCGKNASVLEIEFGMNPTDVDGVDETFNMTQGSDQHDVFYTGSHMFDSGECAFARMFGSTGEAANNQWEEVLLWDPNGNNTVFTALLEQDLLGFDARNHDFQMMVLENGRLGDTSATNYYFYIEVE